MQKKQVVIKAELVWIQLHAHGQEIAFSKTYELTTDIKTKNMKGIR